MYPKIIQKIHNEFYNSENGTEKATRLVEIGFINAQETEKYSKKAAYYRQKYPFYKFITRKQVLKICKKYRLILGKIEWFNGFIPEKNLAEIENFKIDDEYLYKCYYQNEFGFNKKKIGFNDLSEEAKIRCRQGYKQSPLKWHFGYYFKVLMQGYENFYSHKKRDMFIVAPKKQFNIPKGYKVNGKTNTIIKTDPILLQKVSGGYLIITAWGNEASDQNVINSIKN
jgi:hypothetical protein